VIRVLAILAVLACAAAASAQSLPVSVPFAPGLEPTRPQELSIPGLPPALTSQIQAGLSQTSPGNQSWTPLDMLSSAAQMLPGQSPQKPNPASGSDEPRPGIAPVMNVMLLLTLITLVPSILLMCTCFVRILVVLALLRQALGTQTLPPAQVTTALALFTTALVMAPTVQRIHAEAVVPYQQGQISTYEELWNKGKQPVRDFMFAQIEATNNWSSLYMMLNYRGVDTSEPEKLQRSDVDMLALVPAFMLSELKTAFLMGFRIYLPFLVIDMVISTMLISMSMMMLPPVLISLPFKLLLFVLVDGWQLVVGSLMSSFAQPTLTNSATALANDAANWLVPPQVQAHFAGIASTLTTMLT
jgi:flagellar biosynthesis protein FliP